jgi:hypothetical protein
MRQFLIAVVIGLTVVRPAVAQCLADSSDLQMHWRFESSTVDDILGLGASETGSITFGPGKVGNAASFDGASYLRIPAKPFHNFGAGAGMTIETWINPAQVDTEHPLAEWHTADGGVGAHFWVAVDSGGGGRGTLYANLVDTSLASHPIVSAMDAVAANTWQHVSVTYDRASGVARLFVNGAIVHESNIGSRQLQTGYDLYLGNRTWGGGTLNYQGLMDELGFYNRALSLVEIQAIHAAGAIGKCVSPHKATMNIQAVPKLSWDSLPGVTYRIERARHLAPDAWTVIVPNFVATGSVSAHVDAAIEENLYIYRVQVVP